MALYLDQLPLSLPESIADAADYLGLFKISNLQLGWPEGCQVVSLISLYTLVIPSSSIYVIAISYLVRLNHWVEGKGYVGPLFLEVSMHAPVEYGLTL